MTRSLANFEKPDNCGEVWSEARAARHAGLSVRILRRIAELAEAGEAGLPVLRWESVRSRRGVEMVFDSVSIETLRGFVAAKRLAIDVDHIAAAIAGGATSSGQVIERDGHLLWAPDDPDRLPTDRAAELLGVSTREVRALVARGRLRATRAPRLAGDRPDLMIETASLAELVVARNR